MFKLKKLLLADFAALKPSIGITCRFCGRGKYLPRSGKYGEVVDLRSSAAEEFNVEARVMQCDKCGHLELFSTDKAKEWWGK
jgi:hypothetical protein